MPQGDITQKYRETPKEKEGVAMKRVMKSGHEKGYEKEKEGH